MSMKTRRAPSMIWLRLAGSGRPAGGRGAESFDQRSSWLGRDQPHVVVWHSHFTSQIIRTTRFDLLLIWPLRSLYVKSSNRTVQFNLQGLFRMSAQSAARSKSSRRLRGPAVPASRPCLDTAKAAPVEAPVASRPLPISVAKPASARSARRASLVLPILGLALLGGGGWYGYDYWTTGRFMISTDDAYVQADMAFVSPKISGYVASVPVKREPARQGRRPAGDDGRRRLPDRALPGRGAGSTRRTGRSIASRRRPKPPAPRCSRPRRRRPPQRPRQTTRRARARPRQRSS